MSEYQPELRKEFADEEYRYAYAEDFLNTYVATQIRVLREQRGMKQEELAERIGTKQSGISRLENVNYSSWKTESLRKIARALGVRLRISFETFGSLLDETTKFSRDGLQRETFEKDSAFAEASQSTEISQLKKVVGADYIQPPAPAAIENKSRDDFLSGQFGRPQKQSEIPKSQNPKGYPYGVVSSNPG